MYGMFGDELFKPKTPKELHERVLKIMDSLAKNREHHLNTTLDITQSYFDNLTSHKNVNLYEACNDLVTKICKDHWSQVIFLFCKPDSSWNKTKRSFDSYLSIYLTFAIDCACFLGEDFGKAHDQFVQLYIELEQCGLSFFTLLFPKLPFGMPAHCRGTYLIFVSFKDIRLENPNRSITYSNNWRKNQIWRSSMFLFVIHCLIEKWLP